MLNSCVLTARVMVMSVHLSGRISSQLRCCHRTGLEGPRLGRWTWIGLHKEQNVHVLCSPTRSQGRIKPEQLQPEFHSCVYRGYVLQLHEPLSSTVTSSGSIIILFAHLLTLSILSVSFSTSFPSDIGERHKNMNIRWKKGTYKAHAIWCSYIADCKD
jgi:hypothetical protein